MKIKRTLRRTKDGLEVKCKFGMTGAEFKEGYEQWKKDQAEKVKVKECQKND
ncbi:MAG: hypothetical protein ABF508_08975 [Zymomonas mobilis]|uniref:hypothetical protein n=1 Tax=Zymomonas mobilis TaxID=542 RepID=UPI0039E8DDB9